MSPAKSDGKVNLWIELKAVIEAKGGSKDWQEKELALKALEEIYQDKHGVLKNNQKEIFATEFL